MAKKMKKDLVPWEIKIGKTFWLVLSESKPTVEKSKIRGLKFDKIIVDENIEINEKLLNKLSPPQKT